MVKKTDQKVSRTGPSITSKSRDTGLLVESSLVLKENICQAQLPEAPVVKGAQKPTFAAPAPPVLVGSKAGGFSMSVELFRMILLAVFGVFGLLSFSVDSVVGW